METKGRDTIDDFSYKETKEAAPHWEVEVENIPKREKQLATWKSFLDDSFTDEEKNEIIEELLKAEEIFFGAYIRTKNNKT
jgi:hypothetical protein